MEPTRSEIWRRAATDKPYRDELRRRCKDDPFFFLETFVFIYEPRPVPGQPPMLPLIPWENQRDLIETLHQRLGYEDIRIEKSRAQGATWIVAMEFLRRWLFYPLFMGNIVSKDEDSVDKSDDPNSVFWKLDFALERMPSWLAGKKGKDYKRSKTDHVLVNLRNKSVLRGYACTSNVASGGRATAFLMDEFSKFPRGPDRAALASTQPITNSRVFVSSPYGSDGAYYDLMHDDTSDSPKVRLHWSQNQTQNRGLYRVERGNPVEVDLLKYGDVPYTEAKWKKIRRRLEDRGYDLTKGVRSPWYDNECLRDGANPLLIGQELDIDYGGSVAKYFPDSIVDRLVKTTRTPVERGEITFDERFDPKWVDNPGGRWLLWEKLGFGGHPARDDYVVSCDVAAGIGGSISSNSVISVLNRRIGRKVGEFATPSLLPYDLAEQAIAACNLFRSEHGAPAYLIWEANGHGQEFMIRVMKTDFRDIYYREPGEAGLREGKTRKPGFWTTKKSIFLGPYREALIEGFYDNPSRVAVEELRQYMMGTDGQPFHVGEKDKKDPSGAGAAHGDRVIADALGWWACRDFGQQKSQEKDKKVTVLNVTANLAPEGSFGSRRAKFLVDLKKKTKSNW